MFILATGSGSKWTSGPFSTLEFLVMDGFGPLAVGQNGIWHHKQTLYIHKHIRPYEIHSERNVLLVFMGQNDFVPQISYVRLFLCTSVNLHKQKHNIETEILTQRGPKRKRLTDVHKYDRFHKHTQI